MTAEEYQAAARYWEEKDAAGVKLEHDTLRSMAETYIQSHNPGHRNRGLLALYPQRVWLARQLFLDLQRARKEIHRP